MRRSYKLTILSSLIFMALIAKGQHTDLYKYGRKDGLQTNFVGYISPLDNQEFYLSCSGANNLIYDGSSFKETNLKYEQTEIEFNMAVKQFDKKYPDIHVICSKNLNGQDFIGTKSQGIYILSTSGDLLDRINHADGLTSDHITSMSKDKWNNIYFTTFDGSFYRYRKNIFNPIIPQIKSHITYIDIDTRDRLWIGTQQHGLYLYDGQNSTHFDSTASFTNSNVSTIFSDIKNRTWVGTDSNGLYLYDEKDRMISFNADHLSPSKEITDVIYDEGDRLWIATADRGIILLQESDSSFYKLRNFDAQLSKGLNNILDIEWTRDKLWFVTATNGIGWIDFKNYNINLLSHSKYNLSKNVNKVIAKGDYLFISTDNHITRIDLKHEIAIASNLEREINHSPIHAFYIDDEKNIWTANEFEVIKISYAEDEDETSTFPQLNFDQNNPFTTLYIENNNCIIGTESGLIQASQLMSHKYLAPEIQISDIRLFYESINPDIQDNLINRKAYNHTFDYDQNHIGFSFQGKHHTYHKDILYSYKLSGVDSEWSPLSTDNSVNYANLPSGKMKFEVKAIHPYHHKLQSQIKEVNICIATPIWKQKWFPIFPIGLILSMGYIIYSNRIKKIQEKNKIAQDKLKLQNKLLDLERNALQLQMNPHFIFNALNTVKKELRNNDIPTSERILTKFSKMMRDTLEHSRQSSICLEDEIELLNNYLALEQISRSYSFDFKIEHNIEDIYDVHIPPMMLQPFLENAVIHGVSSIIDGLITITFQQKGQMILAKILDNGPGLSPNYSKDHRSLAIQVTRDRLALLTDTRKEHLIIQNRLNDENKVIGAEVIIWLPIIEHK